MPRTVTIALPAARTDALLNDLRRAQGLLTLQLWRGASITPPGDVVRVQVTDRRMPALMSLLDRYDAGVSAEVSVTMSEPGGMMSAAQRIEIARDPSSSSLEEMEFVLARESTMGLNKVLVMFLAGVVAAVGIATNAVHIVVGAMVIAPGFEPLLRIALGVVTRSQVWRRGAVDAAKGYGSLVAGAAATSAGLPALGVPVPATGQDGYLEPAALVAYWRQVTVGGTLVAVAAGLAGALLVAANRSLLTAGVMIALALVPTAALVGVGAVSGDWRLAAGAGVRWLHDAFIVLAAGLVVLGGKRAHRRRTLRA